MAEVQRAPQEYLVMFAHNGVLHVEFMSGPLTEVLIENDLALRVWKQEVKK